MKDKIKSMFECAEGRVLYESAVSAIEENKMKPLIESGVLVGFSGGADSVMLLCFLTEYKRREGDFNIVSLHVNHGIRGAEADRDEAFSRSFSNSSLDNSKLILILSSFIVFDMCFSPF
jgi:tRNA(Ile)-lysidine synthase TilS/MesJ